MAGTFDFGDRLLLEPVPFSSLRPGDIVVYRADHAGSCRRDLVHRVLRVTGDGLLVRGDGNAAPDPSTVMPERIVGRVCDVSRMGRTVPVPRGRCVLWRVSARRTRRALFLAVADLARRAARPAYRLLQRQRLASRLLRPTCSSVEFQVHGHRMVKYVWRGRTVARYWPEDGRVEHVKPYDLVFRKGIESRIHDRLLRLSESCRAGHLNVSPADPPAI